MAEHTSSAPPNAAAAVRELSLSRERRIRRREDFLRIQSKGARVTAPHFLLLVAPRPEPGPARIGIVVSRKLGGAVIRNRAKRLVREAFRHDVASYPEDIDVVVIVRPGVHALSANDVRAELARVMPVVARRAKQVLSAEKP